MQIKFLLTALFILFQIRVASCQPSKFKCYSEIKNELKNSRLVLMGEKTHGDYPSMLEKVKMIKYLYDSLGFEVLAWESTLYDMHQANQLIYKGEDIETGLYKGIFSIWRNTPPIDSLLKLLNQRKITLAGFDNQICSGGQNTCLTFISEFQKFLDLNDVKYSNELLTLLDDEFKSFNNSYTLSAGFTAETLTNLNSLIENIKILKTLESKFWVQNLISINGFLFDLYYNKMDEKTANSFKSKDSNLRDSLMANNVIYLLEAFPDKKIICWGATYHFSNDISKLKMEGDDFLHSKPMGYYLKNRLKHSVKIIGFTDLASSNSNELIESISLYPSEKAYLNFDTITDGCSEFISASKACGDWTNALDIGIIINSKGKQFVKGFTINYDDKKSVPFVHIQIENTSKGVISNENGYFELLIDSADFGRKIIFSAIGYQRDTLWFENIKDTVQLIPKTQLLNEVIVTPKDNDPLSIIHEITKAHLKHTPSHPFNMILFSNQTEINDKQPEEKLINESAIQIYYENRYQKNEIMASTILNIRKKQKEIPSIPWPMASTGADFMTGFRFLNPDTYNKLQIDSIYNYPNDEELEVVVYSHNKPNFKTSGFGVTPKWTGIIIYNKNDYSISSHEQTFQFEKNKDYGLYEITFNIEYFNYKNYTFPRLMRSRYTLKKEGGTYSGEERILVTEIELDYPKKPKTKIFEFKLAPSDKPFWDTFNTIPELTEVKKASNNR